MNVLFVGAHPDDIETYSGGTAAVCRAGRQGILLRGHQRQRRLLHVAERRDCSHPPSGGINGAAVIGAQLIWLNFDDEFLMDSVETRHAFIEAFRIAQPDVVFCHWREDYNPDHSISGMLVDECVSMASIPNIKTASKPAGKIPHVYFMDTPAGVNFSPELYVDITRTFATKGKMVGCHVSQGQWMKDLFGYDLEAFLEVPARFRGLQAGCPMAEAFRPSYRWGRTFRQHYLPA